MFKELIFIIVVLTNVVFYIQCMFELCQVVTSNVLFLIEAVYKYNTLCTE